MNNVDQSLRETLRALAAESAGATAPDRVRSALRAELRARSRRRLVATWWPAAAAAAAALILGVWLGSPRPAVPIASTAQPPSTLAEALAPAEPAPVEPSAQPSIEPPAPPSPSPRARLAAASAPAPVSSAVTPWFFYTGVPMADRGQVVRIRVSSATAANFGIYRGTDTVPAQVFIGDDGLARAIRFVR